MYTLTCSFKGTNNKLVSQWRAQFYEKQIFGPPFDEGDIAIDSKKAKLKIVKRNPNTIEVLWLATNKTEIKDKQGWQTFKLLAVGQEWTDTQGGDNLLRIEDLLPNNADVQVSWIDVYEKGTRLSATVPTTRLGKLTTRKIGPAVDITKVSLKPASTIGSLLSTVTLYTDSSQKVLEGWDYDLVIETNPLGEIFCELIREKDFKEKTDYEISPGIRPKIKPLKDSFYSLACWPPADKNKQKNYAFAAEELHDMLYKDMFIDYPDLNGNFVNCADKVTVVWGKEKAKKTCTYLFAPFPRKEQLTLKACADAFKAAGWSDNDAQKYCTDPEIAKVTFPSVSDCISAMQKVWGNIVNPSYCVR